MPREDALRRRELLQQTLEHAPLFAALPAPVRDELAAHARFVTLRAGGVLWSEGAPATQLGVVLKGRLKLLQHIRGKEVIVDVALAGNVLGEIGLATHSVYSSHAICLRSALVALIPTDAVLAALEHHPRATFALALDLAQKLLRSYRAIKDLSVGSVDLRLARVLLRLADRVGEPFDQGVLLPIKLRRADLAAMAATTLESTSRTISAWKRRGWLQPQPAGYLLRDVAALRALIGAE